MKMNMHKTKQQDIPFLISAAELWSKNTSIFQCRFLMTLLSYRKKVQNSTLEPNNLLKVKPIKSFSLWKKSVFIPDCTFTPVSDCRSLWVKAPTTWINVNIMQIRFSTRPSICSSIDKRLDQSSYVAQATLMKYTWVV